MPTHKVNLALQGGGSHGAFTWGVLDRLLEEESLEIVGISGTSAGAMNAIALADGLSRGGPKAGRAALSAMWEAVGRMSGLAALCNPLGLGDRFNLDSSPVYLFFDLMSRVWSPYQLNPLNYHPVRDLLAESIDFERIRRNEDIHVFLCATNVRTGRRKVFSHAELSVDAVLASACLPLSFQAVEIDGETYWDGGYSGNPAIAPLIKETPVDDVIIVGINPLNRAEVPKTASDVIDRINEISFSTALFLEVEAVKYIFELPGRDHADHPLKDRHLRLHAIHTEELGEFGASSKLNNELRFLRHLHDIGRRIAAAWIDKYLDAIGKESSLRASLTPPSATDER
jgi:NTE family protein